jgi:hypothetical protein
MGIIHTSLTYRLTSDPISIRSGTTAKNYKPAQRRLQLGSFLINNIGRVTNGNEAKTTSRADLCLLLSYISRQA